MGSLVYDRLQTIASRNVSPVDAAVVSICSLQTSQVGAFNIIPDTVDLVDVFRPAPECSTIVDQAIAIHAKAVWTQLRIVNFAAAEKALAAGLKVVMDRCVKMEHGRYGGSLHWAGMNTELITAKKPLRLR